MVKKQIQERAGIRINLTDQSKRSESLLDQVDSRSNVPLSRF